MPTDITPLVPLICRAPADLSAELRQATRDVERAEQRWNEEPEDWTWLAWQSAVARRDALIAESRRRKAVGDGG